MYIFPSLETMLRCQLQLARQQIEIETPRVAMTRPVRSSRPVPRYPPDHPEASRPRRSGVARGFLQREGPLHRG